MNVQEDNLKFQLKLLERKLIVLYGIGLIVLLCLSLLSNYVLKNQAAEQATSLIRRTVARGDYRETIYTLNDAKLDYFEAVVYYKEDGARLFSLPAQLDPAFINQSGFLSHLLYSKLTIDLAFGERGAKLGTVVFIFNRLSHAPFAFLIWLFFVLGTLPIMREARGRVVRNHREQIEFQNEKARADLARRVRHDIRSPLGALLVATRNMIGLDSKQANLVRRATDRIGEIVSELELIKSPGETSLPAASNKPTAIFPILQAIVQEKRVQLPAKLMIEIVLNSSETAQSVFSGIDAAELKRTVSNILDNSLEAITAQGKITVQLQADADHIQICIADNGSGMDKDVLSHATEMGFTKKSKGSGLGLYYAKRTVESAGGTFRLESKLNVGTRITIALPRAHPPNWNTEYIPIPDGGTVIVVDDQESCHLSWKMRLDDLKAEGHSFEVEHFNSPDQLAEWYRVNSKREKVLFLLDYHLGDGLPTGVDLADQLGLRKNIILVTGNFDSEEVQRLCADRSFGLLAKSALADIKLIAV